MNYVYLCSHDAWFAPHSNCTRAYDKQASLAWARLLHIVLPQSRDVSVLSLALDLRRVAWTTDELMVLARRLITLPWLYQTITTASTTSTVPPGYTERIHPKIVSTQQMQTGLLPATLSLFVVESYESLSPDSGEQTVSDNLSRQLVGIAERHYFGGGGGSRTELPLLGAGSGRSRGA
ncbi:hypothetical protein H4582DRAFT_2057323 [Lactarius indigo]|nr:hypothetical protein H4582DRAFT_2057323 [Lactarius indigo]